MYNAIYLWDEVNIPDDLVIVDDKSDRCQKYDLP